MLSPQEIGKNVDLTDDALYFEAMKQPSAQPILGYDIPKARLTRMGYFWSAVYLGGPVALLGNLLDLTTQLWLGWCVGFWCML